MKGLLIDLDGVLYVGDRAIPGAPEAISWLQDSGLPHMFVTNTTSRPRAAVVARLADLGMNVPEDDILTPAVAASDWLHDHGRSRVASFIPPPTEVDLRSLQVVDPEDPALRVDAVLVGDLGTAWSFDRLNAAFAFLMQQVPPALVALGMTRYWRAPTGLRLDTGPFVRALEFAAGTEAVVTGKPAAAFFHAAAAHLGLPPAELVMVGDDIRGDVAGAQDAGMAGVLVRTGKFSTRDLESGVTPDDVLDSVADLGRWWPAHAGARQPQ